MSAALFATLVAACTGALVLLHAVLRCKESSESLLDEYGKLLLQSRTKAVKGESDDENGDSVEEAEEAVPVEEVAPPS
ncbi:MAG: hypothetical protein PVJ57_07170 [Phycisphaerae bacterium]